MKHVKTISLHNEHVAITEINMEISLNLANIRKV